MTMARGITWNRASRSKPCEYCERWDNRCAVSDCGTWAVCYRRGDLPGAIEKRTKNGGVVYWLYRRKDAPPPPPGPGGAKAKAKKKSAAEIADPETLNAAYRRLLGALELSEVHRRALAKRGFPGDDPEKRGYRTLPIRGLARAFDAMLAEFDLATLLRVPGFFRSERGELALACVPGLLIPCRDAEGRIVALLVRPDKVLERGPKYLWVSSSSHDGPSPGAPAHVPLGIAGPVETLRVTEGLLKGDLVVALTMEPTVGVPGVGNWGGALPIIKALGAKTVRIAYDADWRTKPIKDVAEPLATYAEALLKAGYAIELEVWDIVDGKGLDDLLARGRAPRILGQAEAIAEIERVIGRKIESGPAAAEGDDLVFANVEVAQVEGKTVRTALGVDAIDARRRRILGDWPKRAGNGLFIQDADYSPYPLDTPPQFFAAIDRRAPVRWARGETFISQERYFEHLRATSERFISVERMPHWPQVPNVFYMYPPLPWPSKKLDQLLERFSPFTETDRDLIRAFILTPFWGGPPGRRPAFLFLGPEYDDQGVGRATGKSTLPDIIADELAGGSVDIKPSEDIGDIKTRLLSPYAMQKRLCRLDNLKTHRFSWGDLEGLITSTEINGHVMYQGDGGRPNLVTWYITLNGASLSKDMAQRVIPIRLKRPTKDPEWENDTREFVRRHRWELIAEIGKILTSKPPAIQAETRWSKWEKDVLSHVRDPEASQRFILDRQEEIDDDDAEQDNVRELFQKKIRERYHDPDETHLFIPAKMAADWLNEATNEKHKTNRATTVLLGLGIPELRKSSDDGKRGWRWFGKNANPNAPAEVLTEESDRSF